MKSFGLNHSPIQDFCQSQWQTSAKSVPFLVYRWIHTIIFTVAVTYSLSTSATPIILAKWFTFLSHWGMTLCLIASILAAIHVTMWHLSPQEYESKLDKMPTSYKFYWTINNAAAAMAFTISLIYWMFLHNYSGPLTMESFLNHLVNATLMFIDLLIVAYPIKIQHVIHPVTLGTIYSIFSWIYFISGGTNEHGDVYIYTILDWRNPTSTLKIVFGNCFLTMIFHFVIFGVYKIRQLVWCKFYKKKERLLTPTRV